MKTCTKCGESLPVEAFSRDTSKQDGRYPSCKSCRQVYYAATQEERRTYSRQWYAENRELGAALTRHWQTRHRERTRENSRRWKKEHPDRIRVYRNARTAEDVHRRRARLIGNGGSYTTDEWEALCEVFGERCLACGSIKPLTVDHVIPLSQGGTNWIDNLQPLCGPCNTRKGVTSVDYRQEYCPCVA